MESVKNKGKVNESDYEKVYQMDVIAQMIKDVNVNNNDNDMSYNNKNNNCNDNIQSKDDMKIDDKCDKSMSVSSPLFKNQDIGRTFKDLIIFNNNNNVNVDISKCLFKKTTISCSTQTNTVLSSCVIYSVFTNV